MTEYATRDHMAQGEHYVRHVSAMTAEGLRAKSAIAAELAHRDIEITRLRAELAAMRKDAERSNRHLLTPDMIAAEDAAGGVVAAGALAAPEPWRHPSFAPFQCPECNSVYFGPIFEGRQHVGRYCKGWPSGHDRSYIPCKGGHTERFADMPMRSAG